jgi:hypothetical protein
MRKFKYVLILAMAGLSALGGLSVAQVVADRDADVAVDYPEFDIGTGPRVAIDSAHHNFHTLNDRFWPFAALLRNDGFRVADRTLTFSTKELADVDILVVANALNEINVGHWSTPTPSAFKPEEITAIKSWVDGGGSLLLIADHFPFAGAAVDMAAAFGFTFINGFALRDPLIGDTDVFTRKDGTLRDDVITRGRGDHDTVSVLITFTGSAFQGPPNARRLLVFPGEYVVLSPEVAWEFNEETPRIPAGGYLQGAAMVSGNGRIAVFGEAGLFSAQKNAQEPLLRTGFNVPKASENKRFILNVMRWLAGALP